MALPGYNIRVTPNHAMTHEDDSESTLEKMIPDHHDLGNVRRFESRFRNGIDHQPVPPPKMIVKDKRNRDTRTQRSLDRIVHSRFRKPGRIMVRESLKEIIHFSMLTKSYLNIIHMIHHQVSTIRQISNRQVWFTN